MIFDDNQRRKKVKYFVCNHAWRKTGDIIDAYIYKKGQYKALLLIPAQEMGGCDSLVIATENISRGCWFSINEIVYMNL